MKHGAILIGAAMVVAGAGGTASARRMAPPAKAALVQLTPERFVLEASVLVDLAVDGLAGRIAVVQIPAGGYRLESVAADSKLGQLGLRSGDVIAAINGVALTNRAALRRAHTVSRTSRALQVQVTRGGKAVMLHYRVVEDADRIARAVAPLSTRQAEVVALMRPGIKRIDATHVEIDQAVLRALAAQPLLGSDAVGGLGDPLVVYRGGSLLEALGLAVFDRIVAVDGHAVGSERALEHALGRLETTSRFSIELERDGAPLSIAYTAVTGSFDATALEAALPTGATGFGASADADAITAAIDKGVRKRSDTHYEIKRSVVDEMLADPMAVARGARIVPSVKNGQANGFKLYAVRPSSIYAKVGFMNGDTVHAINGMEIASADRALEAYSKLRTAKSIKLEITRRGKPVQLRIDIK
ncbi:MAG TPA: type II secretion system protein GspC [Kofleriaceae bacterium]|nr:type II secretion system protein GspC [Kofleriaceae bacterium]